MFDKRFYLFTEPCENSRVTSLQTDDDVPLGSCDMQRSGVAVVDIGGTDVGAYRNQLQQLLPIAHSRRVARIVVEPHLLSRRSVQRR